MRRYPETYLPRNFYVVESGVVLTPTEQQSTCPVPFVVTERGARIVAGRDATPEGIGALTRHAEAHERAQREAAQRVRRAA